MLLAVIIPAGLAAGAQARELTCRMTRVEKLVEVQKPGGAWIKAAPDMVLRAGDKVHTGFQAKATLGFEDGSTLDVKPMTLLVVSDLETKAGRIRSGLILQVGEVGAQVGRKGRGASDFEVKTATCTASVRGTEIARIAYTPAQGTVVAMGSEGRLRVQTVTGRVTLGKADQSRVARNAPPLTPGQVSSARGQADVSPKGITADEAQDVRETGVPKTTPITVGGSGVISDLPRQAQPTGPPPRSDVTIPLPRIP
jgi:hypothetical protein